MSGFDVQLFFTAEDEQGFSKTLAARFPEIVFIDWVREFTANPALRTSLDLCGTNMAEVWNRGIYSHWPQSRATPGAVIEPDTLVIHRSRLVDYNAPSGERLEALVSGSLGWGGGDQRIQRREEMRKFAEAAMAIATSMHTGILVPVGYSPSEVPREGVSGYIVGPAAARWCVGGQRRVFKVSAGLHLYTVHMAV